MIKKGGRMTLMLDNDFNDFNENKSFRQLGSKNLIFRRLSRELTWAPHLINKKAVMEQIGEGF